MKIEFRKVSSGVKDFALKQDSVNFEGTFCKISSKLVEVNAKLSGETEVQCCKCGQNFNINLNEELEFIVSDGEYSSQDESRSIIEFDDGFIDFDEIIQSEIESIKSDYHTCEDCIDSEDYLEKEL